MYGINAFIPLPVLALAAGASARGVWTTPHDKYSSSVGVLGCKINTNRVAYWPGSIDCNNICIKLTYEGRSTNLLRIDQSGGAYDISYDAWVYLQSGKSATENPMTGGPVAMEVEEVDASQCAGLINTPGSKLPLSASNSMNYLASCLSQPNSWVAQNHVLYNICDAICTTGNDEVCSLDLSTSNQPSCPHTLGLTSPLSSAPVHDINYQTGQVTVAGSGLVVSSTNVGISKQPAEAPAAAPAPAASSAPAPAAPAPVAPTQGGVFAEISSSSISLVSTPRAEATPPVPSPNAPVDTPANVQSTPPAAVTTSATDRQAVPTAATVTSSGSPATGVVPPKSSTLTSKLAPTARPSGGLSNNGTAVPPTTVPPNGGIAGASLSTAALVAGLAVCSIFGSLF